MATTSTSNVKPFLTSGKQSDQSIFDVAQGGLADRSAGIHTVGTRAVLPDGRVYRYARSTGAAIVAGKLLQTPDQDAQNSDLAVGTEVLGSTTLTVTLGSTAAVEGEFAGGYAITNSGTLAAGLALGIASHPAAAASASLVLTLSAPNPVLFHADTTVTLLKNPWGDVIISGANQDHFACGVAPIAIPAGTTNAQFFWCQTWGPAAVWQDAATANGSVVTSGTTAGQVEIRGADGDQAVGQLFEAGVDGDYSPTFLTIAP